MAKVSFNLQAVQALKTGNTEKAATNDVEAIAAYTDAIDFFDKALGAGEQSVAANRAILYENYKASYNNLIACYTTTEEYALAIAAATEALKIVEFKDDLDLTGLLFASYFNAGITASALGAQEKQAGHDDAATGAYQKASAMLIKANETKADDVDVIYQLALVQMQLGASDEACDNFAKLKGDATYGANAEAQIIFIQSVAGIDILTNGGNFQDLLDSLDVDIITEDDFIDSMLAHARDVYHTGAKETAAAMFNSLRAVSADAADNLAIMIGKLAVGHGAHDLDLAADVVDLAGVDAGDWA